MSKLNVIIGYDDWKVKVIQLRHMFIAGSAGTGKSYHLRSMLSSIISLNKDFTLHLYSPRTIDYNMNNLVMHSIPRLEDTKQHNKHILSDMRELLESRKYMINNMEVEPGKFKPAIYVFDDVIRNASNDDETMRLLRDVLAYGDSCCITFIITSQSHYEFGTNLTDSIPIKIVHRCLEEVSDALVGSTVAASADFGYQHKIAVRMKEDVEPTVLDAYTITEEQGTNIIRLVSYV